MASINSAQARGEIEKSVRAITDKAAHYGGGESSFARKVTVECERITLYLQKYEEASADETRRVLKIDADAHQAALRAQAEDMTAKFRAEAEARRLVNRIKRFFSRKGK